MSLALSLTFVSMSRKLDNIESLCFVKRDHQLNTVFPEPPVEKKLFCCLAAKNGFILYNFSADGKMYYIEDKINRRPRSRD